MSHQNLIYLITLMILSLHSLFESCDAECTPSSCGIIPNISYPLRLKGDPKRCGDRRYELSCENNVTSISLHSHKYYVKEINYANNGYYDDYIIRLVDASIKNDDICSFPTYSLYAYHFGSLDNPNRLPYQIPNNSSSSYPYKDIVTFPINFISCPNPLRNSALFTDITTLCVSNSSNFRYIKVGHMKVSDLPYACGVDLIVMTSSDFKDFDNVSLSQIHEALLYGFQLYICPYCRNPEFLLLISWGKQEELMHLVLLCYTPYEYAIGYYKLKNI